MQRKVWTILFLIIFFPIGLFLMWKHQHFTKATRVIITLFFLILILLVSCSNGTSSAEKAELKKKEQQLINKEKELEKFEKKLKEKEKELDKKSKECQKNDEEKKKSEEQKKLEEEKRKQEEEQHKQEEVRKQEEQKKQQEQQAQVKQEAATPAPQPNQKQPTEQGGSCNIKGNKNSKGEKIYHMPGQQFYDKTNAEEMFCSEAEAKAAGYRASKR
ncbi:hypothetical protein [Bacillus pseudomycoides]|uniref:sunset domain-containing protein n=1 Tax=Bacillus pseudomycoides TaxID=64104 RepID=UPI000BF36DD3|nr:hypothetical protein [Bacillus pseudomycoides]PEP46833.1 hypothetical protein CN564_28505 [Bacillus pseudomycoides]PGR99192.1 hypothetical protein COC54_22735 [Bacillus pseudomycoides]PHC92834.1 hypothetical protein COF36_18265 [Bacillus pseudomycoides]